jgi:hypothetical protein
MYQSFRGTNTLPVQGKGSFHPEPGTMTTNTRAAAAAAVVVVVVVVVVLLWHSSWIASIDAYATF